MTITGQNIEMYQGDTKRLTVAVEDVNELPVNISGATFTWTVYKQSTDVVVLQKVVGSGITILDEDSGTFKIDLSRADTLNLLGHYNHECEMVDVNEDYSTIFTGYFKVFSSKANKP